MTLKYIGTKHRSDMIPTLDQALKKGWMTKDVFEAFLETIRNVQT